MDQFARGNKDYKFVHKPTGKTIASGLSLVSIKKDIEYSLLEYLQGGLQMGLVVGIDFTGSNGNPKSSNSLHYFNPARRDALNMYQQAILSIGNVLLNYDADKMVSWSIDPKGAHLWVWS